MDNFVGDFVSEQVRDFGRAPARDLEHVRGRIVYQSAPELDAVGIEQAHAVAAAEIAADFPDTRRQQRTALDAERLGRAAIDAERAGGPERESDPMLAALEADSGRDDQGAGLAYRIEGESDHAGLAAFSDYHRDSR